MHIVFLTNPASGQLNVQLATAQQIVSQGHCVTFLSGESCRRKVDRFRRTQETSQRDLIRFIGLGSGPGVEDFTLRNQEHKRRPPGDPVSADTCIEFALGHAEEDAVTAIRVRDHLNVLDPNMICVDALTPPFITGVRLTKRKFILTITCSPGLTALPGVFQPHPMATNRRGSWGTLLESVYLNFRGYLHSRRHPARIANRDILCRRFGLKSYGVSRDTSRLPPHWEDHSCVAGIHFNTPGLTDSPRQSSKMVFVGAGVPAEPSETTPSPELAWMDEALALGEGVVYIDMGSMFVWQPHEFWNCIAVFNAAYTKRGGRDRFLFNINFPVDSQSAFSTDGLPFYIRVTDCIENQRAIYSHPALKLLIHKGGGNSFNEAVYFGIPQLVMSQWLDTHEYAHYVEHFGLGLRSKRLQRIDAEDIEAKILTLLGPSWATYKSNCQTWAVRSQISGGAAAGAKVILCHAESAGLRHAISTPQLSSRELSSKVEKGPEALERVVVCA